MTDQPSGVDVIAPGDVDPSRRLTAALDRAWAWFVDAPIGVVVPLLLVLVVARSGVALGRSDLGAVLQITRSFPEPVLDWRSNSPIGPALGHLAGVRTSAGWFTLHAAAVGVLVVVVALCIRNRVATASSRRLAAVYLAIGSLPPVLLQRIGSYDPFTAIGAVLVVIGRNRLALVALGGALIGFTSAEQGALAFLGAAIMVVAVERSEEHRSWLTTLQRSPTAAALVVGAAALIAARVAVLGWFAAEGAPVPSRGSVAGDLLSDSLRNAASAGGAGIYAWFGLGWGLVLVGWLVSRWNGWTTLAVLASLVVPGAAATWTTLDGTRVFVMVSLPAFLVLLLRVVEQIERSEDAVRRLAHRVTIGLLVVSPLFPALIAEPSGGRFFVFPWGR